MTGIDWYLRALPVVVPVRLPEPDSASRRSLTSRAYRITVDGGRDSFFALSIEEPGNDDAWLASDTVHALENRR